MSVKTITHVFSSVVGSGGTASVNKTIDADNIAILFVKVEPSIMGGTTDFEIFQKDTLLAADISYKASVFTGDLFDPVEDVSGVETERTEGFVTAYQDDDASKELHIKVTNNDTSTKDFTITIRYLSAGDLTSTGTPVNNQIAVWTDVDTLEGDANLTWDGTTLLLGATRKFKLPQEDDATSPTLQFGDGDSGFYESADDILRLSLVGAQKYFWTSTAFASANITNGFFLANETPSSTNPLYTFGADEDTGMSRAGANILSLITGGVEAINISATQQVTLNDQLLLTDINTETLAADKVIAAGDPMIHFLDPGGAARNVDLMPEVAGQVVIIVNTADMAETLTIREDAGATTIVTVDQNEMAFLTCNGTVWKGMVGANT